MRLGYTVGWKQDKLGMGNYPTETAPYACGMDVFPSKEHAEIVLAAEKLKSPTMAWMIFEIHADPSEKQ